MTARRGRSADEPAPPPAGGRRRGRVESAINAAVRAARADGLLGDVDAALIALARAQARAVDVAEAAADVWALARVGGQLRESLICLRLDPQSRGIGRDDSLTELIAQLGKPAPADPAGTTAVGDSPQPGSA